MSFAKKMQGVADKLLTKFDERTGGNRLAILKQGAVVWNDTIAENVIGPDVKYYLTGVQINTSAGTVNGTTIQSGDMFITVSTLIVNSSGATIDYVPRVADKVLIDGVEWSVVDTPHANYTGNNLIVAYKLQVRK